MRRHRDGTNALSGTSNRRWWSDVRCSKASRRRDWVGSDMATRVLVRPRPAGRRELIPMRRTRPATSRGLRQGGCMPAPFLVGDAFEILDGLLGEFDIASTTWTRRVSIAFPRRPRVRRAAISSATTCGVVVTPPSTTTQASRSSSACCSGAQPVTSLHRFGMGSRSA
jgi:hypothetical protein